MLGPTLALVADVTVQDRPGTSSKVDGHRDEERFDLGKLETPDDDGQTARRTLAVSDGSSQGENAAPDRPEGDTVSDCEVVKRHQ